MRILATIVGIILVIVILVDSFETIVLPRRVSRRFRLSRWFYTSSWLLWASLARKMRPGNRREFYLSYYGPLSLIILLVAWAAVLVVAFALFQWGVSAPLKAPENQIMFGSYLYMSGTTFVTLGYGDVTSLTGLGRFLAVAEAGMGFLFLALIIGYVPVIYQAFSQREINITLLDARAGSPPSATEMLRRHYRDQHIDELLRFLRDWERWSAELLESHLSYPVLNALADHLLLNLPPWIPETRTIDDWQTSAWDHFAEWSPEKLDEITHIIVDHKKKTPVRHEHVREQSSQKGEQHTTDGRDKREAETS